MNYNSSPEKQSIGLLNNWLNSDSFYTSSLLKDSERIQKIADEKALNLFHLAARKVPAYMNFLKKKAIDHEKITTIDDFKLVPPTTKENYIDSYSFGEKCWDGAIAGMHMISTSSGTTGVPYFWSRDLQAVIEGASMHELFLKYMYEANKKSTLLLNGFALGRWIAGTFTLECLDLLTWKGYPIVSMTPGYDAQAVLEVIQSLPYTFDQIIITGFVPFLKELAELFVAKKINTRKLHIYFLGTGQGITENWREYVRNLIGNTDPNAVINLYGSADAALMGIETPLSIDIRKKIVPSVYKDFFGENRLPSLYNFDPRLTYFESVDGELHSTKYSGIPLIRYNMHDKGGIIPFKQMDDLLSQHAIETSPALDWKLPFVYLFGRDKFMVKIYGANVYGEHVAHALGHEKLQKLITGKYHLELEYDDKENPIMTCKIELNHNIQENEELKKLIEEIFIEEVAKLNSEYRHVLNTLGNKVKPKILLYEHGHKDYFPRNVVKKTS